MQPLVFIFEKCELMQNKNKCSSNQCGKKDVWENPVSIKFSLKNKHQSIGNDSVSMVNKSVNEIALHGLSAEVFE
jgi:hypothetical protein